MRADIRLADAERLKERAEERLGHRTAAEPRDSLTFRTTKSQMLYLCDHCLSMSLLRSSLLREMVSHARRSADRASFPSYRTSRSSTARELPPSSARKALHRRRMGMPDGTLVSGLASSRSYGTKSYGTRSFGTKSFCRSKVICRCKCKNKVLEKKKTLGKSSRAQAKQDYVSKEGLFQKRLELEGTGDSWRQRWESSSPTSSPEAGKKKINYKEQAASIARLSNSHRPRRAPKAPKAVYGFGSSFVPKPAVPTRSGSPVSRTSSPAKSNAGDDAPLRFSIEMKEARKLAATIQQKYLDVSKNTSKRIQSLRGMLARVGEQLLLTQRAYSKAKGGRRERQKRCSFEGSVKRENGQGKVGKLPDGRQQEDFKLVQYANEGD